MLIHWLYPACILGRGNSVGQTRCQVAASNRGDPGFHTEIGRLVCILTHSRQTLTAAVDGLSCDQLDHLHDEASNSIGALLAHATAVEWWHQVLTFGGHVPSASEEGPWVAALDLGAKAREQIQNRETEDYLQVLGRAREKTLSTLAKLDDTWLERPLVAMPERNAHWEWFHVAGDESATLARSDGSVPVFRDESCRYIRLQIKARPSVTCRGSWR